LQLGVGFRHDADHAARVDQRDVLQAQRRGERGDASSGVIGWSTFRVTVPFTRGSTMKVRPVREIGHGARRGLDVGVSRS